MQLKASFEARQKFLDFPFTDRQTETLQGSYLAYNSGQCDNILYPAIISLSSFITDSMPAIRLSRVDPLPANEAFFAILNVWSSDRAIANRDMQ